MKYEKIVRLILESDDDERPVKIDDIEVFGPEIEMDDPTSKGELAAPGQQNNEPTKVPGELVMGPGRPGRMTAGIMAAAAARRQQGDPVMGMEPEGVAPPRPGMHLTVRQFLPVAQQMSNNDLFDRNIPIKWHMLSATPMYSQFSARDRAHFEAMVGVSIDEVVVATDLPVVGQNWVTGSRMMDILWETIRQRGRLVDQAELIEFPDEDPRVHRVENPMTYDLGGHRFYLSEDVYADGEERYRFVFWGPGGGDESTPVGGAGTRLLR